MISELLMFGKLSFLAVNVLLINNFNGAVGCEDSQAEPIRVLKKFFRPIFGFGMCRYLILCKITTPD